MKTERIRAYLALFVGTCLASASAVAATIGPDAYGYRATSDVPFAFTNISATGTQVLPNNDDSVASAAIGFNFDFYGATFSSLFISTNGLISFDAGNAQFTNQDLSATSPAANVPTIAVLWDDWVTSAAGADAVYYQTVGSAGSRQFIVQWNEVQGFSSSPSTVTFQAILFEGSNDIYLNFLDTDSGDSRALGASSTVGIRDTDGQTNGRNLQWSFNERVIDSQSSICIDAPGSNGACSTVPEPGTLALLGLGLAGLAATRRRKQ